MFHSLSGSRPPLVVSIGDPSGVGPDILLSSFANNRVDLPENILVLADPDQLRVRTKELELAIEITEYDAHSSDTISPNQLAVVPLANKMTGKAGISNTADAAGTLEAIERGVEMVMKGKASGLVTCPINKKVLQDAGFSHPGHTEFLAELAELHTGNAHFPVMMIAGPELRVIPVTIHIPLLDIPKALTKEIIIETAEIAAHGLNQQFGISSPRLAVSGLNPHAGERGNMGHEDIEIIMPAIEALKNSGIDAFGPLPADTMFHAAARQNYDVAICMYHDQALIPAKAIGFDDSVNVTLGLPFIRTSPDHGTAYDIAGTGKANPSSFIAAMQMASNMANSTI